MNRRYSFSSTEGKLEKHISAKLTDNIYDPWTHKMYNHISIQSPNFPFKLRSIKKSDAVWNYNLMMKEEKHPVLDNQRFDWTGDAPEEIENVRAWILHVTLESDKTPLWENTERGGLLEFMMIPTDPLSDGNPIGNIQLIPLLRIPENIQTKRTTSARECHC
jgi:hypothetical protein